MIYAVIAYLILSVILKYLLIRFYLYRGYEFTAIFLVITLITQIGATILYPPFSASHVLFEYLYSIDICSILHLAVIAEEQKYRYGLTRLIRSMFRKNQLWVKSISSTKTI
jgi:hypothetical protein